MKNTIIITLILILICRYGNAQQVYRFDDDKLSCNQIKSLAQDGYGFIWIATEDGLNKFDGWTFTSYFHDENDSTSLINNYINQIFTDSNQQLWIATNKGLQYYSPREDAFHSIPNIHSNVSCLTELHNQEICFAVSGSGLYILNTKTKQIQLMKWVGEQCDYSFVNCIYEDSFHNIWISFLENRLACINPATHRIMTYVLPNTPFPKVYGMKEDSQKNLYIITFDDVLLKRFQEEHFISIKTTDNHKVSARGIILGKDGKLWVNTINKGLMYIDIEQEKLYKDNSLISKYFNDSLYGEITSFLEDRNGNKWLAYRKAGLTMITNEKKQFEFWDYSLTNPQNYPTVIYQTKDSHLWIGNQDKSLSEITQDGKLVKRYMLPNYPKAICEDGKGSIWIGCNNAGLYQLNREKGKIQSITIFQNKDINKLISGKNNQLFISFPGNGLGIYDLTTNKGKILSYQTKMKNDVMLGNDWINDLTFDSNGMLWITHFLGLSCYNPETKEFIKIPVNERLKKYVCYTLLEDKNKQFWIGTNNGIFLYTPHDQNLIHFGKEQGIPSNIICGIQEDRKGNIWCSTYKGLCRISHDGHNITNYFSGNGLVDKEYTLQVSLKDKAGFIYFGGTSGITRFMPNQIQTKESIETPTLSYLYINNIPVDSHILSQRQDLTKEALVNTNELRFKYTDNIISLEFSTFDFHDKKNVFFEYRIKELGEKWNRTAFGSNHIDYNYLHPGNYTLEVRACKNDMTSPTRTINLYITPPWYQTQWAFILYYLSGISLIIFIVYYYFYRKDQKRKEEANEEKLRFFINIAHEIRSPLTLIISPLNEILHQVTDSKIRKDIQIMEQNARRIMNLIDQLLDIRRIDKGQMKIACQEINLISFIQNICDIFEYQAKKRNIQFNFIHNIEELPVWIDPKNFDKIIINLLTNAFKYTADGGNIEIIINTTEKQDKNNTNHYISIYVKDTGTGIDPKDLNKIFDRFYQSTSHSNTTPGFGIGLNLAKMLVELHHGNIKAENRTDRQGSCFIIHIPSDKKSFKEDEIEKDPQPYEPTIHLNENPEREDSTKKAEIRKQLRNRILLVDDDLNLCKYIQEELYSIYNITICNTGQDALQIALSQPFDLIISDIVMPGMNGFELLEKIKNNTEINHIPVILLTSQAEAENRVKAWTNGADAFLSKPFKIEELISLCSNLIDKHILLKGKYGLGQDIDKGIQQIVIKSHDEQLMERLVKTINTNLSNPNFTVEILAENVGISRVQLHRKLKELLGLSASEFIRNLRLKQATVLLKENDITISQIAYAVGFSNPILFSSTFKKAYGCSPTEYREQVCNKK